jgi:hypothetical protein
VDQDGAGAVGVGQGGQVGLELAPPLQPVGEARRQVDRLGVGVDRRCLLVAEREGALVEHGPPDVDLDVTLARLPVPAGERPGDSLARQPLGVDLTMAEEDQGPHQRRPARGQPGGELITSTHDPILTPWAHTCPG